MEIRALLKALAAAEQLKNNTRHSWTSAGRHESVAEHSWRLALMAYFVKDEYPELDMDKVIRMCLIHDLGEAFTGDIPAFVKTKEDEERESALLSQWVESLPSPFKEEMGALYREMDALETGEAKLCKALDRMETIIQHNEAPLSTWLPLEYEKNQVYGREQCAFSPYTKELQETVKSDCLEKIRRGAGGGDAMTPGGPLLIITGPTAVGKTALSIQAAKALGGEVVSADSMQVYRHMDIGSAKVTRDEMEGVPHHLIDVLEPWEPFNVAVFQRMAREAVADIQSRGKLPIIAGGTGFYIQALLYRHRLSGDGGRCRRSAGSWNGWGRREGPITFTGCFRR